MHSRFTGAWKAFSPTAQVVQHCPVLASVGDVTGKEGEVLGYALLLVCKVLAQCHKLRCNTLSRIAESKILSCRCNIFLNCLWCEELLEFRPVLIIGTQCSVGFCFCQVKIVHL